MRGGKGREEEWRSGGEEWRGVKVRSEGMECEEYKGGKGRSGGE